MQKEKKNIFLYFGAPIFAEWFLMIGIQVLLLVCGVDIGKHPTEVTALAAAILIPIFWYVHKKSGEEEKDWWKERREPAKKEYLTLTLLAVVSCVFLNFSLMLIGITEMSTSYQQTTQMIYQAPGWVQILGLAVLVPAMEELVYRVILYTRMRRYLSRAFSIIGSGMIFGIYHGNLAQFIFAFLLGMVLAYLMERYRSFKVVFYFHAMVNLTSILCTWTDVFQMVFRKY